MKNIVPVTPDSNTCILTSEKTGAVETWCQMDLIISGTGSETSVADATVLLLVPKLEKAKDQL